MYVRHWKLLRSNILTNEPHRSPLISLHFSPVGEIFLTCCDLSPIIAVGALAWELNKVNDSRSLVSLNVLIILQVIIVRDDAASRKLQENIGTVAIVL